MVMGWRGRSPFSMIEEGRSLPLLNGDALWPTTITVGVMIGGWRRGIVRALIEPTPHWIIR
ncbi:MAG: hypothetical protein VKJ64_15970 [Leptolyngbyaceae bacterium]|nr:hypothetical protein [Leptolyngbyaceae bacterium]